MTQTQIRRFMLSILVVAGGALYTACGPQLPEPKVPEVQVENVTDNYVTESYHDATESGGESISDNDSNQPSETTSPEQITQSEQDIVSSDEQNNVSSDNEEKPIEFPVPSEADGAELLEHENISFVADETPMSDVAATVRSARKNKDASSMFIVQMMYRDHIGDIAYYNNGKKQETEISAKELHREMIRWRDAAYEANYELAILATNPSVQYEVSPFFTDDDEFKKGLNWLKKAAAHGYGNAEYILGLVYFNGVGTKRNKKKGFELLVRAAAHGVINAYYAVGMIYELGLNGKKDTDKSFYWLDKASHLGSRDAIFILAMKYFDGIGVPKDEAKARELEKLDPKYHAWIKLRGSGFYHIYCIFRFDESAIGWTELEGGGCEMITTYHNSKGIDEDKDDYTLDEIAESSLDYKIDYRLAAGWLKKMANFDTDYSYILRSQTNHITGCRGIDNYDDILLSPDSYDDDDYDGYPVLFKKFIIALNDHKVKPSKLKKMLFDKADQGDREALFLLGKLYEDDYGYEYIAEPLGIEENLKKAFEYYENVFNIDDEMCKTGQKTDCLQYDIYVEEIADELAKEAIDNKDLKTAYEWYEKSFGYSLRANNYDSAIQAGIKIASLAADNKDIDVAQQWFRKIMDVSENWYKELNDDPQNDKYKVDSAGYIAKYSHLIGDDSKAIEWYNLALSLSTDKKSLQTVRLWLELAQIYHSEQSKYKDYPKAMNLYKTILSNNLRSPQNADISGYFSKRKELYAAAFGLCELSFQGEYQNKPLARETCKRAMEIYREFNSVTDDENEIRFLEKIIEEMPKIDLLNEVEKQIKAEKGKKPDKFFVIQKVLAPCEDKHESEDDGEDISYRCDRIVSYYNESVSKAITAITALSIARGSVNIEEIENTYYYLAIYKANDQEFLSRLRKESAVYASFFEDDHYAYIYNEYLTHKNHSQLFYVWYLRQIPYAAAEEFKKLQAPKSWDEYISEARELIQSNAELHQAFGYDLLYNLQKFVVPDNI